MEPEVLKKSMSNAMQVSNWMMKVGQGAPARYERLNYGTLMLRESLIAEEFKEVNQALAHYRVTMIDGTSDKCQTVELVKELCDLLVVVYGTLTAMGVDADDAFAIVMSENFGKVEHAQDRGDGKVVVPPDVKQALKVKTRERLMNLIGQGC